ncbi:MAG: hypothetical protein JNN07_09720 [Verrucomicrobiales bacterium]|nr:hypothetical protein [Verrucomicrobiales bacterium]
MRSRGLFIGFVVLNVAFAVALIVFVAGSGSKSSVPPPATLSSLPAPPISISPSNTAPTTVTSTPAATLPVETTGSTGSVANVTAPTPPAPPAGKQFGWQDIETASYGGYLENLRRVGCPEKMIRQIIFHDANELFNQRRLEASVKHDFKWWQPDDRMTAGGYNPEFQSRMQTLVLERRELLTKLLGENWEQEDNAPSLANHTVALTGPVLGGLPVETYMAVQEICARSVSRHQDYLMGRFNEGQASSQVELAKLRDMTRKDLSVVLDREGLEEFLLRFSHNSSKLRQDLRGLGIGADEFRKIFRATDQIDHQIQLEYGGEESLSSKQREQLTRQREKAIAGVLGQDRYERLILSRDPLFRQAQMIVMQSGAAENLTQPMFDILKRAQLKRQQVQVNTDMTQEQKQSAMIAINQEQVQEQRKLLQPPPPQK